MIIMGTDIGPSCPHCRETIWSYTYDDAEDRPQTIRPRCKSCNKLGAAFDVWVPEPTIVDVRRAHCERVANTTGAATR